MNNTNFQTFHQMGTAINEFVKQATGRDNVQNIDIDHVTVAQNHYYEDVDVSGIIASFMASASVPLDSCIVQIEPIQSGSGDPAPDNVRPITGWTGAKVQRTGKNLLDTNDMRAGIITVNGTINPQNVMISSKGNGSVTWTSTVTWRGVSTDFIDVREGNTYSISLNEPVTYVIYAWYDRDKNFISRSTIPGNNMPSITAPDNAYYLRFSIQQSEAGTYTCTGLQVESGSASAYEPYQGQTYPISWQTEAGTVYSGTLNVTTGELVVDTAMVEITDESNFVWDTNNSLVRINVTNGIITDATTQFNQYTQNSMFLDTSWAERNRVNGVGMYFGASAIFIKYNQITSVDDARTFFTNNPMTVVYKLAEPQTYQLTPTEIQTIRGQNNIWADTGSIEVKFTDLKELY